MKRSAWALGVIAFLAIVCVSLVARADDDVEVLKSRGNQAMMNMNYAEALAAYRSALEKNPADAALYYNIARAHQAREEYPEALDALREFDAKGSPEVKAKVPALAQLVADITSRVGTINLRCSKDIGRSAVLIGVKTRVEGCGPAAKVIRLGLPTKSATLEIKVESNELGSKQLSLPLEGGKPPVNVTLEVFDKATTGVLRVRAQPVTAVVSVDGKEHGNSPLEVEVAVGSHALDVQAEGHESAHIPVVVDPGSTKDVVLTLEKKPPITKKWWFWAGVGTAVVGIAVVTTILIVQPERDASRGSIEPGTVSAPLVSF